MAVIGKVNETNTDEAALVVVGKVNETNTDEAALVVVEVGFVGPHGRPSVKAL